MPDDGDDTRRPGTTPGTTPGAFPTRATGPDPTPSLPDEAGPRPGTPVRSDAVRRRRRESFLADLDEAQRLRERVAPRRTRMQQLRQQQLLRTYLH